MSLKKLIHQCKKKDIRAQEKLYRMFSGKLFGLCLKYSNSYEQAEDSLQDGFITIFNKIGQYKDKGSFEGWMKRIVINTTLQHHRKNKYFEIINDDLLEDPAIEIDNEELSTDFLLQKIQELPDRYREIFNLYVLDGFSHKEIAEMLNISVGSSKSNLARARNILKNKIEDHLGDNKVQSL